MKKLRVVFFGTPDFSLPSLELLANHSQVEVVEVVSMPDRPAGRGRQLKSPEVIDFSKTNNLPFFQTENINREEKKLKQWQEQNIDAFIVLAFAQFLSDKVLSIPKFGAFNIHTSLLPRYRGAAPIQYAILNGDKVTGVSIQRMVKKMDAGEIAKSSSLNVSENENTKHLYTRLKFHSAYTLNEFLTDLLGDNISYQKQDESRVSFAPVIKKEDGHLNFEDLTAKEVLRKLRAFDPWPGVYFFLNSKRFKVHDLTLSNKRLSPGESIIEYDSFFIGCKEGSIKLQTVQIEGKKACPIYDFTKGHRDFLETIELT